MKVLMPKVKGKADGKVVNQVLAELHEIAERTDNVQEAYRRIY